MAGIQRIGILTSGGDCAGLNPVIRAVVSRAAHARLDRGRHPQRHRRPAGAAGRGGRARPPGDRAATCCAWAAPSSAPPTRATPSPSRPPMATCRPLRRGHRRLPPAAARRPHRHRRRRQPEASCASWRSKGGIKLVGIPKTIDNDLGLTEVSIGFETAVQAATSALDHLTPTAASHSRVMVLEVMGRDCRPHRAHGRHRRRRRRDPDPGDPLQLARIAAKIEDAEEGGPQLRPHRRRRGRADRGRPAAADPAHRRPGHLWRHRPLHQRAHRRAHGRRDPRHRARPCPARRLAGAGRPRHRLGLRHRTRSSSSPLGRFDRMVAWQNRARRRRADRRGHRPLSGRRRRRHARASPRAASASAFGD